MIDGLLALGYCETNSPKRQCSGFFTSTKRWGTREAEIPCSEKSEERYSAFLSDFPLSGRFFLYMEENTFQYKLRCGLLRGLDSNVRIKLLCS